MENMATKENLTQEEILEKYGKLIHHILNRNFKNKLVGDIYSYDDLFNEGFIILVKSYANWKPEKGPFIPYAIKCISCKLKEYIVKATNKVTVPVHGLASALPYIVISADAERIKSQDDKATKSLDTIEDKSNPLGYFEIIDMAKSLSNSNKQFVFWKLHYCDGFSWEEIGETHGCSRQWAEKNGNRLNRRLKHELEGIL